MNVDKFGRSLLSLQELKLRLIENKIDNIDRENRENIKRFAGQLFYWINAAHSSRPSTMVLAEITRTKDDYIDWTRVFK